MKAIWILLCMVTICAAQEAKKEFIPKEQPDAVLERFYLKSGRSYEGVWDGTNSQIHLISKTNHIGNYPISTNDLSKRVIVRKAPDLKLYSDVDMAEKILIAQLTNLKVAKNRVNVANKNRDVLHQTYKGKNLPGPRYDAVMRQYKAADDAISNADSAVTAAQTGFQKALDLYQKAGGKTVYTAP